MKIKWNIIVPFVCVSLLAGACSSTKKDSNTTFDSNGNKEKAYQGNLDVLRPLAYSSIDGIELEKGAYLSVIGKAKDTEYWKAVKEGAEQAVEDLNKALGYKGDDKIKVTYSAPSKADDVDEQVNILDEELARYPAALGIAVVDSNACAVQFDLAAENNIPIVEFDSGSDYQGIVSMCSTDNKEAAQAIAKKLSTAIDDKGEVAVFVHDSVSTTGRDREQAFVEEIQTNHPDVSVVKVYRMDELSTMAQAIADERNAELKEGEAEVTPDSITQDDVAQYILKKNPNIKGCFATNEETTQLVVKACDSLKKKDITVMGFDGGEAQMKALKDGKIEGLLVQNPFGMGYATVVAAARAVTNLPNEAVVNTGYTWVTKDNMDSTTIKKVLY